jgi:hypothetical protein
MRPIAANIQGSETEKHFFHHFRTAQPSSTPGYMCDLGFLWKQVAMHYSQRDAAVKHAVIALSAAQQLAAAPHEPSLAGLSREGLDVFIIQQYNKSISSLQQHASGSSSDSIQRTLVCCLAFICLETLRRNRTGIVTHLINGLNILHSLPAESFAFLADASASHPEAVSSTRSTFDLADIIRLFGRLEISACVFAPNIRPIVAERGYAYRRLDDGSTTAEFHSLQELHQAVCTLQRDVLARQHEVSAHTSSNAAVFWSDPLQLKQHDCLVSRASCLDMLLQEFLEGPLAPLSSDASGCTTALTDLLQLRATQAVLADMDDFRTAVCSAESPLSTPSPMPSGSGFEMAGTPGASGYADIYNNSPFVLDESSLTIWGSSTTSPSSHHLQLPAPSRPHTPSVARGLRSTYSAAGGDIHALHNEILALASNLLRRSSPSRAAARQSVPPSGSTSTIVNVNTFPTAADDGIASVLHTIVVHGSATPAAKERAVRLLRAAESRATPGTAGFWWETSDSQLGGGDDGMDVEWEDHDDAAAPALAMMGLADPGMAASPLVYRMLARWHLSEQ